MKYKKSSLRKKTYRTYAALTSGAAVLAAASINYHMAAGSEALKLSDEKNKGQIVAALENSINLADKDEKYIFEGLRYDIERLSSVKNIGISFVYANEALNKDMQVSEEPELETKEVTEVMEPAGGSIQKPAQSDTEAAVKEEEVSEPKPDNKEAKEDAAESPQKDSPAVETGYGVSQNEYEALLRIVEAEAGNQDDIGRILVANIILNRVESKKYPNSILENIFKKDGNIYQFEPIANGYYYQVIVSDKTKECVNRALAGEDYSQGALYFTRKTSSNSWFNTSLTFLFTHGPHYFYK